MKQKLNSWLRNSACSNQTPPLNSWGETMWGDNKNREERCWQSWRTVAYRLIARLDVCISWVYCLRTGLVGEHSTSEWTQKTKRLASCSLKRVFIFFVRLFGYLFLIFLRLANSATWEQSFGVNHQEIWGSNLGTFLFDFPCKVTVYLR